MQLNFILQLDYADMLIHARLADRHDIHSTANAVLFRGIFPCLSVQFCPGSITKVCPSAEVLLIQKAVGNRYPAQAGLTHGPMRHQIAVAKDITTSRPCAGAYSIHISDCLLWNYIVVVIAATIFLCLCDLVLGTPGTFKMFAGGLPIQVLILVHILRRVWRGHLPPAVVQLTTLLWRDPSVVTSICADLSTGFYFGAWELLLNNAVHTSIID